MAGLGADAHALWAYGDDRDFREAAMEFLDEGRHFGQRLLYVGPAEVDALGEGSSPVSGGDALEGEGGLGVLSHAEVYEPSGSSASPEDRVARFEQLTEEALASGYTGLRVVAEITDLVRDPAEWETYARFEACLDRYMAENPLSSLCCLDTRELPEPLIGDLARVHPCSNVPSELSAFRIFAGDGSLVLDGEVDAFSRDAFNRLLDHTIPADGDSRLDLAGVGFIDHVGVLALAKRAETVAAGGGRLEITGAPYPVTRMCDLLGVRLPPV